ncbi:hypothetical protein [Terricaulis sp.]|uniref:hypothetical protein n=1 Tax=Terricaulis sp. TaxID=2768686 RepID=UPI002AC4AED3|nr:hypothetical protein [Terricaulis sp.]MDZ4692421.1 hypothetical protein [Terricaulis sp.]
MNLLVSLAAALTLAACATSADQTPAGPPSLEVAQGQPAPPQARFYVDCIAQASQANTYDREGNVIRFHCNGVPAQAFFEGLASWSAQAGSEINADGATWRFSTPIRENPSFVDFCRRESEGATARHQCTVVLNVGEFLAQ